MRTTRWVMVAIGMAWLLAPVIPGWQVWMIVFAAVLVAYSVFGLMVDKPDRADARATDPGTNLERRTGHRP